MTERLLEWMSFRRAGKISDVPPDLAEGKTRRALDDLCMLGHLELQSNTHWRIAPPVLAGLPSNPGGTAAAVLCGARTPGVLAALNAACIGVGASLETIPIAARVPVIRVAATTSGQLASAASAAGLPLQHDAALTLLACTPAIRNWPRTPCPMVGGRVESVQRFSKSRLGWVEIRLDEAASASFGFFRIKRDWDQVSLLKTSVSDCAYVDDRAGRLAVAAKLKSVTWEGSMHMLELPRQLFPPLLIARALTLCSGFLPQHRPASRRIAFAGVTQGIMKLTLAITGLRLA